MIEQVVRAGEVDFACLTWGEGPLVVLVHGFPDTARTWDLVGPRIAAAGFRVVAPNTRGISPTSIPADGRYDTDTLARDLIALVAALGETSAILVGHDFGAAAAYSAAGLAPERWRKLVTMVIPHPATIVPTVRKVWGVRHFLVHRLPGAARRFAAGNFAQVRVLYERWSPGFAWPESEFEAVKKSYAEPGSLDAALGYYRALTVGPTPGLRARISVPTLILGGRTDGVAEEADFEASRRRFTGPVEVRMLPGGHFLHREDPEAFLAVLLPFLTGDDQARHVAPTAAAIA